MDNRLIKISDDNPFKDQIRKMISTTKSATHIALTKGVRMNERVTVTVEREYISLGFAKLTKDKELLRDLSPYACKILVFIALNMEYGTERIHMPQSATGLSRRTFPEAVIELMQKGILKKEKREWYWVNIALIIVGAVDREHFSERHDSCSNQHKTDEIVPET